MNKELYEQWHSQLAESIAENDIDKVTNLITEPYFDELLKDSVKCQNLLRIAGVEHNRSDIFSLFLEKMEEQWLVFWGVVDDIFAKGYTEVVQSLYKYCPSRFKFKLTSPERILQACSSGNSELVSFLIEQDTALADSVLNAVCAAGHLNIVEQLINAKIKLTGFHQGKIDQNNPFSNAAKNNRVEVLNYLLKTHKDKLGDPIQLLLLICEADNPAMLEILESEVFGIVDDPLFLEKKIQAICDKGSIRLLNELIDKIGKEQVKAIINRPIDNNYQRKFYSESPFINACNLGHVDIVERLLECGANVAMVDESMKTPLHAACHSGHKEIVNLLLIAGKSNKNFNVNATYTGFFEGRMHVYRKHFTPLTLALRKTIDEDLALAIVRRLYLAGADLSLQSPLTAAIVSDKKKVVDYLLDFGVDVNQENCLWNFSALAAAVKKNDLDLVSQLLSLGADVDKASFEHDLSTPLLEALDNRCDPLIINALLNAGADVNRMADYGYEEVYTSLSLAIKNGYDEDILSRLLKLGADINKADKDGFTPLMSAVRIGRVDIVELLLAQPSIDIFIKNTRRKKEFSALDLAKEPSIIKLLNKHMDKIHLSNKLIEVINKVENEENQLEVIRDLVERGADINNKSPLVLAIYYNLPKIANYLLDLGASLNQKAIDYDYTPLCAAILNDNTGLVLRLLTLGADVNKSYFDQDNNTSPLLMAIHKSNVPVINALLDFGADINIVGYDKEDALFLAIENDIDIDTIRRILNLNPDINRFDDNIYIDGSLLLAMQKGRMDLVNLLLDYGANINKTTVWKDTALILAIKQGCDKDIISRLLTLGADVNKVDQEDFTPLMRAAQKDNIEVIKLLLKQPSIKIDAKNTNGFSAADLARSPQVRELINQHVKLSQDAELSQGSSSSSRPLL